MAKQGEGCCGESLETGEGEREGVERGGRLKGVWQSKEKSSLETGEDGREGGREGE